VTLPDYVLVSACRNEGPFLADLAATVAQQSHPPRKWLIVDDGSTDDTFARAEALARQMPFLEVVRMPGGTARSFSSQVFAAMHGCQLLARDEFAYLGLLDADIRLPRDYYRTIVGLMEANPRLGLCGGQVLDRHAYQLEDTRAGSEDYHVAGGIQFFRRACFEAIGGHHPIPGGGQDTVADIMAMMKGWEVRVVTGLPVVHLRPEGFSRSGPLARGLAWGRKFHRLGYHPLYYLAQCANRITRRPWIIGSLCNLLGFAAASIRGAPRPVSPEFVRFIRQLQLQRLRTRIASLIRPRHPSAAHPAS
jgi:biofilm PGA synthesis N-glycosyltransferase PgaC